MTAYAKELQMDTFMISYNGAVITDLKEDRNHFERTNLDPRANSRTI
jgi:hydroxymethylpyrimidine pyrophosphatase-like HAD family hydrolase